MFRCNIWGDMYFSERCVNVILTPEFQRLKNIKQLGLCSLKFPKAVGNRFEHSLGTGWLSKRIGSTLHDKYPKRITPKHVELITLAGLLHDIGHGPLSHVFDRTTNTRHEDRSEQILRRIAPRIGITDQEVNTIALMISPKGLIKERSWLYQIVSGNVDSDRMDYLVRDSTYLNANVSLTKNVVLRIIDSAKLVNDRLVFDTSLTSLLFDTREVMYDRYYNDPDVINYEKDPRIPNLFRYETLDEFLKLDEQLLLKINYNLQ